MRSISRKKVKVITSASPQAFETEINNLLDELDGKQTNITWKLDNGLTAIIEYLVTEQAPETAQEKLAERNIFPICGECEYLQVEHDGRKKYFNCPKSTFKRSMLTRACEWKCQDVLTRTERSEAWRKQD